MPRRLYEAEAVDLIADGRSSFARGDFTVAVDRFLRAGRRLDADKRRLHVASFGEDAVAMALEDRERRRVERAEAARLMFVSAMQIGFSVMSGFSVPVAVFGGWTGDWQSAAEDLFVLNCAPVREDGCWQWIGAVNRHFEPVVSIGGPANHSARAFAYRLFLGDLPRGLDIEGSCETERCVSVEHIRLVPMKRRYDGSEGTVPGDRL